MKLFWTINFKTSINTTEHLNAPKMAALTTGIDKTKQNAQTCPSAKQHTDHEMWGNFVTISNKN
jgi:hypothetical protein